MDEFRIPRPLWNKDREGAGEPAADKNSAGEEMEKLPEKLDVIFEMGDVSDLNQQIAEGYTSWAACVDIASGNMYIGDSHNVLLRKYPIAENNYWKVGLHFDAQDDVRIFPLMEYRPGLAAKSIDAGPLKDLILSTVRRDVLKRQT